VEDLRELIKQFIRQDSESHRRLDDGIDRIKLDVAEVKTNTKTILERLKDHEDRLRDLETTTNKARGGWAIIAGVASVIGGFVTWLLQKLILP